MPTHIHEIPDGDALEAGHFVRFYDDDNLLITEVAGFMNTALQSGGGGIIIATPAHINDLHVRLTELGYGHPSNGKLITLDAEQTLAQFMIDEWPDEGRFNAVVGKVVRDACAESGSVNAFGEMVALLCEQGLFDAAIRLEQLWNDLAASTSFSLFCAYPWNLFPTAELSTAFQKVCEAHDHICGHGNPAEAKDANLRLAELEQKSRVLEAEIARRTQAEQILKEREQELADFLENSVEGLHRVGPDGTILWANKAELNLLGYRWDEYIGQNITEFHVERSEIENILKKLKAGETLYDHPARLRCKNGAIKHVLIHSNGRFENGQLRYTRCATRDATERHERDRAIEQRDRMLLQAPIATALLSIPDFTFHIANERFCELTSRRGIEGKPFAEVFPELKNGELAQQMRRVAATGKSFSSELEFVIRAADGGLKEHFIQCNLEPLVNIDGDTHCIIFVATDITQRVKDRQQLQMAHAEREKLVNELIDAGRAKDEFLAMLGHELRNPLAPVLLALELMRTRDDKTSRQEREIIERQVQHMTRLVDDLLDISRITRGTIDLHVSEIELSQVLAKAVEMASPLFEQRSHHLNMDIEEGLRVQGDPMRLAQVVSNLLTNAARYTDTGGEIILSARRDNANQLCISVRDNGIGIPDEMLTQIFHLFFQRKQDIDRAQGGLGIGLSIVKNIIELHGGSVEAKSAGIGHGSEFILTLPVTSLLIKPESATAQTAEVETMACKRRIMVVDDNEDAADTLAELFELNGHEVKVFYDPIAALAGAPEFKPEIAVLDIGLPVLDGYELAARLRSVMDGLPCRLIALTGYGQEADKAKTQAAGFEQHLVKPVRMSQINQLLVSPD